MKGSKVRLYVGCGLTHASPGFVSDVERLKNQLRRRPGLELLDFVGLGDDRMTPRQVWEHDIGGCVEQADAMLAVCDEASIGLGIEMGIAIRRGIPVLGVALEGRRVTRLVLDPTAINYQFRCYRSFEEIPRLLDDFLGARFGLPVQQNVAGLSAAPV